MKVLHLKNTPIFEQLQIEEALLRVDDHNYCIINEGSPPAIVMGISGKPVQLIDLEKIGHDPIPVIKRYSGGGTVVVDEDTIFVSFLCNKKDHDFAPYPEPIMRWSEEIYQEVLGLPEFSLRENDYVLGERKFGGNAQYLRKDRWLHHTTFLWDYQSERMDLLLHPRKTPSYRVGRSHEEFVTRLKEHVSKERFVEKLKGALAKRYSVENVLLEDVAEVLKKPHRKSTESILLHHLC